MSEFQYPEVGFHTEVVWRQFLDDTAGEVGGYVIRPKTNSCDILVQTENGLVVKRDCVHEDDPRVKEYPQDYQTRAKGLFRISPRELQWRQMLEDHALLMKTIKEWKLDEPSKNAKKSIG